MMRPEFWADTANEDDIRRTSSHFGRETPDISRADDDLQGL
jgi:hypothetical protein